MTVDHQTIDILLLGSGGREHALAMKLAESPLCGTLYIAPGKRRHRPGGRERGACRGRSRAGCRLRSRDGGGPRGDRSGGAARRRCCRCRARGRHSVLRPRGRRCPVEGSKRFSKELMGRAGVPTAAYGSFTDEASALAYVREQGARSSSRRTVSLPVKGVVVATELTEAEDAVRECFAVRSAPRAPRWLSRSA